MIAASSLEVRDLSLRAGAAREGRILFESLTFDVRAGDRWVVLGRNGAGKSSLLAALAGVFERFSGTVAIDGRTLDDWPSGLLADRRAWCPQFWSDPFPASVLDTVQLARDRGSWWQSAPGASDAAVHDALDRLDLSAFAQVDVRTLSGGERQRVAIATTLLQGAPLLLLDEPASHLDLGHQHRLVAILRAHALRGGAIVASLHDLNLAWDLASHVVLLDGRGGCVVGERDMVMTATQLGDSFGVVMRAMDVDSSRRFWSAADSVGCP